MSNGPWPKPFVGTHIRLWDYAPTDGASWGLIPYQWQSIRFDAMDVLFISPFHVEDNTHAFILGRDEHGTYEKRFTWVIQSARSKNPMVKIILVQMMATTFRGGAFSDNLPADQNKINSYAASVAAFLEAWYNKKLLSLDGTHQIDARLNGYEVDVEDSTLVKHLPIILTAVRHSLDALSAKLHVPKFTVSICPAWKNELDATVARSVEYLNMQRYSGGHETTAADYAEVTGLAKSQLIWGLCSEEPYRDAPETKDFAGMKKKVQEVVEGHEPGIWTWKVNSDNFFWANDFQVWLYNNVHGITLPGSKSEDVVRRYYEGGGRLSWKYPDGTLELMRES